MQRVFLVEAEYSLRGLKHLQVQVHDLKNLLAKHFIEQRLRAELVVDTPGPEPV